RLVCPARSRLHAVADVAVLPASQSQENAPRKIPRSLAFDEARAVWRGRPRPRALIVVSAGRALLFQNCHVAEKSASSSRFFANISRRCPATALAQFRLLSTPTRSTSQPVAGFTE